MLLGVASCVLISEIELRLWQKKNECLRYFKYKFSVAVLNEIFLIYLVKTLKL